MRFFLKLLRHSLRAWLWGWAACVMAAAPAAELVVAVPAGVEIRGLQSAILDYRRLHGVAIDIVYMPRDALQSKVVREAARGFGGYDVVLLGDPSLTFFVDNDYLEELTSYLAAAGSGPDGDFLPKSLALCRHPYASGPYYCLPYVGNSQMFFYNRMLFAGHGLEGEPDTWDKVFPVMEAITRSGGGRLFGYVLRGRAGNPVVTQFMPILWSFGGRMFDDAGNPQLATAAGVAALEFFAKLAAISPPGPDQMDDEELAIYLRHGVAASSINWPAWAATLEDPASSRVVGQMAYTVVPGGVQPGSGTIGHWLLAIMKSSRHKQAAFDFITWATSPEQMKLSALRGSPPVRASTFADPELLARPEFRHYPALLRAIETSTPRPRHPQWEEIEQALGPLLTDAVAGRIGAQAAMEQADRAVAAIVGR